MGSFISNRTLLQVQRYLTLALETAYRIGEKPVSPGVVETIRSISVNLLFVHVLHIMHIVHITVIHSRHGIGAVIGELGVEPLMNGGDQRLVFR